MGLGAYLGADGIQNGIRLKVSSWARHDPRAHADGGQGHRDVHQLLARQGGAVRAGYDEALLCTTGGLISEATGENVFVIRDGRIFTPPASSVGALEGITSDAIVTIARDLGYTVTERDMRRTDLYMADEAFLTGTAAEVVPVVRRRPSGRKRRARTDHAGDPGDVLRDGPWEVDQYKDWLDVT